MGFGKSAHPGSCACPWIYVWFHGWDYRSLFLLHCCRLPKQRVSEWVFLQRITRNYRNYLFTTMKNRSRTRQNGCSLWSSLRDHDTNKLRQRTARWAWGPSLAPCSGSLSDSVSDSVTESSAMLFTAWTCAFWSTAGRDYHGFENPCGLRVGYSWVRVRARLYRPSGYLYPWRGLAVYPRVFFRSLNRDQLWPTWLI